MSAIITNIRNLFLYLFNCRFICLGIHNYEYHSLLHVPTGIPSPGKSIFAPGVLYLVKEYKKMELKDPEKETCRMACISAISFFII